MRIIIFSFFVTILLYCANSEKYTTKYDNVDIDKILANDRLIVSYANCILDKGKCTTQGQALKDHIIDALETGCKKCSEKQEEVARKAIIYVAKNKPDIWREAVEKYDPNGKYRTKYAYLLKEAGIQ